MATNTSVFDDLDDVTAQMCINLILEDIIALPRPITTDSSSPSDEQVALRIYEADLKAYRVIRGYAEPLPTTAVKEKPTKTAPPATQIARFKCGSCLNNHFNAEEVTRLPCRHYYCDECLEDLITHSMGDKTLYPPRCCRQIIPWETFRDGISEKLAAQFEAKKEELDDKSPVYCHQQQCSKYIKANVDDPTKATCPACHATTCTLCKQDFHEGACPQDEEVQKMREYAKEEGCQECTQCHQLVELSTGCNHITYEFCYCCGVKWKECPCDQWDEDRLVARAGAVAGRVGMGGAAAAPAIAERLRRNHRDCDNQGHGFMEKVEGEIMCDGCGARQSKFIFRCYHCHVELCYRCKNNRA